MNARIKPAARVTTLICAAAVLLSFGALCRDVDPDGNELIDDEVVPLLASTEENAAAVNEALGAAEAVLREGRSTAEARDELLARLQSDPEVLGAAMDVDSGAVYADFRNGETQIFSFIDSAADQEGSLASLANAKPRDDMLRAPTPAAVGKQSAAQGTGLDTYWRMPSNNRALLVNAIAALHPDSPYTNSTNTVWKMLSDRGYEIEPPANLTVDHFTRLTDYGLIVIEAHGLWREPSWPQELLFPSATCGGDGSRQALLTTTVVTPENTIEYARDLVCGRLMAWNTSFRDPADRRRRLQTYAVTPNFVREHDPNVFPSNTILYLNSCRGFNANFSSPYEQPLFEKCPSGARFMGWTQKVDYAYAGRALVNLFQLATCSNEDLTIAGVRVLQPSTPPQGAFASMRMAWSQLNSVGWTFDPATLGQLVYTDQQQDFRDMILMPYLVDFLPGVTSEGRNQYEVNLWSAGVSPLLTIGGHGVSIQREGRGLFTVYRITGSTSAYFGDMELAELGRSDVPTVLHRWRPSISITNSGDNNMKFQITLTLHARAAVTNRRSSAWQAPPRAAFGETYWDKPLCWVAWNVSGEHTYDSSGGRMRAVYSGSGSRAFLDSDHGSLQCSEDGTSVNLSATAYIIYTTTLTNLDTGETSTHDTTADASADLQGVALADNWTIGPAVYLDNNATLGDHQVSWNAIPAEPPFDPNGEPR
jgi:hypothetical protein